MAIFIRNISSLKTCVYIYVCISQNIFNKKEQLIRKPSGALIGLWRSWRYPLRLERESKPSKFVATGGSQAQAK